MSKEETAAGDDDRDVDDKAPDTEEDNEEGAGGDREFGL